ncbi:MAG: hypothetical protein IPM56_00300 [Ignavibacteriales bacterium]|nr:MAG: hypothetical protein IPM56_00300 [Ignavibacteriales bacterium]
MKFLFFLAAIIFFPSFLYAQDSLQLKLETKKLGIGIDGSGITSGPQIVYYTNGLIFSFTYGLHNSSTSNNTIRIYDKTLNIRASLTFAFMANTSYFLPIYVGTGYTYIDEKDKVLEYSGPGYNTGYSVFIGTRLIESDHPFFSYVGTHFELGYSFWNYSNSVLKKNSSVQEYNYSKFYFSFGACYYIF